jgi:hypothetical protein
MGGDLDTAPGEVTLHRETPRDGAGQDAGGRTAVVVRASGVVVGRGLWFAGQERLGLRPWADLTLTDLRVLPALARTLGPGAVLMVVYDADATERALRRKVPPAATPLGLALLDAGCRWFKDWYFAEGGREGPVKLQGTIPPDDAHRRRAEDALARELRAFLARPRVREEDRAGARRALTTIAVSRVAPSG